jgi:hypothetical protein
MYIIMKYKFKIILIAYLLIIIQIMYSLYYIIYMHTNSVFSFQLIIHGSIKVESIKKIVNKPNEI